MTVVPSPPLAPNIPEACRRGVYVVGAIGGKAGLDEENGDRQWGVVRCVSLCMGMTCVPQNAVAVVRLN